MGTTINTPSTSTNYTWTANQKNKTLDYGVAATLAVIPNTLTLRAQLDKVKSDGLADYTYYTSAALSGGYTNDTVDSENWDDYTKESVMLKATYTATKSLTLVGGYAYEHYKYNDQFTDGYRNVVYSSTGSLGGYLTGAGSDPNYTANVVFLTAKHKF